MLIQGILCKYGFLAVFDNHIILLEAVADVFFLLYRCNSFIVDLRHKFTVRNMNKYLYLSNLLS